MTEPDQRAQGWLPTAGECHEGVSRAGEFVPCEKPAVAVRMFEDDIYPVCAYHARRPMMTLQQVIAAAREQGRREGAEQALRDAARMARNGAKDFHGLRGRVRLQSLYNEGASPWLDGLADAIARGDQ